MVAQTLPPPRVPTKTIDDSPIAYRTRSKTAIPNSAPPRVVHPMVNKPIARRTRAQTQSQYHIITTAQALQRKYPSHFLHHLVQPVLEKESGKLLEYRHLRQYPRYAQLCNTSYPN